MRFIIPENLLAYDVFKQIKILADEYPIENYEVDKSKDLPSLYELLYLTNPNLGSKNLDFIYNVIFAKKGLVQVLHEMATYMHFQLNEYKYEDYNLSIIDIKSITSDDGDRFYDLFVDSLNALLFFGSLSIVIQEMIQNIEAVIYKNSNKSLISESSYTELSV